MRPLSPGIRASLLAVMYLLCLTACEYGIKATTAELRVGISPHYPPLVYRDSQGNLSGIEIAVAETLARNMRLKVVFVEKQFSDLIPAVQAGEVDVIMSGLSITPERSKAVSFTAPYLDAGQMAIIRFEDAARLSQRGAVFSPGAKTAVVINSTGAIFASQYLKSAKLSFYPSIEDALDSLQMRYVDFVIHDAASNWALASDKKRHDLVSLNRPMTVEHLAWAVAKSNPALLARINEQLGVMQKNGSLRAIILKWVPVTLEAQ